MSASFGQGSAFVAELKALELGLEHAWNLGLKKIKCNTDCVQLCDIFSNTQDISSFWDRDLIIKVRTWLARSWTVSVHLIPRTRNTAADFLARQAASEGTSSRIWSQPSASVLAALCHDAVV